MSCWHSHPISLLTKFPDPDYSLLRWLGITAWQLISHLIILLSCHYNIFFNGFLCMFCNVVFNPLCCDWLSGKLDSHVFNLAVHSCCPTRTMISWVQLIVCLSLTTVKKCRKCIDKIFIFYKRLCEIVLGSTSEISASALTTHSILHFYFSFYV